MYVKTINRVIVKPSLSKFKKMIKIIIFLH